MNYDTELGRKQKDLEVLIENERLSHCSLLKSKDEEYSETISIMEEKMAAMQKKLKKVEKINEEITDELTNTKLKIKSTIEQEENLKCELKNVKAELAGTRETLNQVIKNHEIAESELHIAKMQLLKENNINNRLLEELKRIRKDIDGYHQEIDRLKNLRDTQKNNLSKEIKQLASLIADSKKENNEDDLKSITVTLTSILKENFILNSKINDVYTVLTRGEIPLINASTQTSIGLVEMFSYENMDKEATCLVMKLREELVSTKSDLLEIRQQNESMREFVRKIKEEKAQRDLMEEEENRVERLEEAVIYLKQMLKEEEKPHNIDNYETSLMQAMEGMRKDLDKLKKHVIETSKQKSEPFLFQTRPLTKPVKLLASSKNAN